MMFTNAIFDVREVARETNLANRVIPVDHEWESAASESQSTIGMRPRSWNEPVRCDPRCAYWLCMSGRRAWTALFGSAVPLECSGCLECTLMSDE